MPVRSAVVVTEVRTQRARGRPTLLLLALTLTVSLLGCAAPAPSAPAEPPSRPQVQRILDRQARAVLDGDATAYLAAVDPAATNYRAGQRRMFANLRRLPLRTWSYRVTAVHDGPTSRASTPSGGRAPARALAVVELSHQLRGYDQGVRVDRERLLLTARDGDWYLSGEDEGSARQLWKQGKVSVSRGKHSLVLGVGRPRRELEALVSEADRAVPAVSRLWPRPWNRRVVVLAPASLERTAELLSAAPAQYRGIAAVTTSERHGVAPADRVVVNPGAYGTLSGSGRQVVMTHETAHVATREDTTETTPMWLSEGLADWIGYGRGSCPGRFRRTPSSPSNARQICWRGPTRRAGSRV